MGGTVLSSIACLLWGIRCPSAAPTRWVAAIKDNLIPCLDGCVPPTIRGTAAKENMVPSPHVRGVGGLRVTVQRGRVIRSAPTPYWGVALRLERLTLYPPAPYGAWGYYETALQELANPSCSPLTPHQRGVGGCADRWTTWYPPVEGQVLHSL